MTLEMDAETTAFVNEIAAAPTIGSLDLSQEVVLGNFSDRDVVDLSGSDAHASAEHVVQPPIFEA
ncbi:MAG: hypothetical protein JKY71_08115 [Alphaproteobacteria bacterium]|nr:hypothetical protein [Alphaproteobacteria bacterium]